MKIIKELTRNDTGETGSNQEGITIPKVTKLLKYFPLLDPTIKNPRKEVILLMMIIKSGHLVLFITIINFFQELEMNIGYQRLRHI